VELADPVWAIQDSEKRSPSANCTREDDG